ncbi:MAG TPA: MFS transporter [Candidatus Saccharimonadales bacterium]|jgi:DHA3 family macrolide efflux protein-like MFS transporter|nr:MFS transporter [Candidatus Saccharimonadales bacterium]
MPAAQQELAALALPSLWRTPFLKLWLAQVVSVFGDFLALFGIISLITFRWHGTPVQVTTVMLAFMLPMAIISPAAGVFVDRWSVKRLMISSDVIRALLVLALPFVSNVFQICLIFAALSAVSSFFAPAQSVALRQLVATQQLMAANAMLSQAFYAVRILSPAVAAALVSWLSEKACFYADSVTFALSACLLATLALAPSAGAKKEQSLRALTADFLAGNKFIFTHAGLAFVFLAMAAAMLVMSAFGPLISIYVRDTLARGPAFYGVVSAMIGVGLIAGSQLVARLSRSLPPQTMVLSGLLGLGLGAALLGVVNFVWMTPSSTFIMGFAIAFVLVPAQTMTQQETPREMVGRVSSSFMSLISLSQAMGLLLSGFLANLLGMRPLFVACAGVLALLAAAGYLSVRSRNREAAAIV